MNKFFDNLVKQTEDNPILALGAAAAIATAVAKLVDAGASVRSRNAYAKKMNKSSKKR